MAYKKKEQPGIMLYWEVFDAFEDMLDGEAKQILRAMRMYAQYGEAPSFENSPALRMAWSFMRPYIDRDTARYKENSVKKSEAGTKSAETRWGKTHDEDNEV